MDAKAYQYPVLWWYRIIPYLNTVRGWRIGSNHYTQPGSRDRLAGEIDGELAD